MKGVCPSVRPSVRLSVCPVDRQQQRRLAGLLLRSGAASRYRSTAAAAGRHAGRVNFGPTDCEEIQHLCYENRKIYAHECMKHIVTEGASAERVSVTVKVALG